MKDSLNFCNHCDDKVISMLKYVCFIFLSFQMLFAAEALKNVCSGDFEQIEPCHLCDPTSHSSLLEKFSTEVSCVSTIADIEKSGVDVPKCPKKNEPIDFLDNTYPTGALFVGYTSGNLEFLKQLKKSISDSSKVNVVLPMKNMSHFMFYYDNDKEFRAIIDSDRINLIPVNSSSDAMVWMQDSFQFSSLKGKPALYQLEQTNEEGRLVDSKNSLACEIARNCDLPIYQPEKKTADRGELNHSTYRAGGNFEVMPGETILTGGSRKGSEIELDYRQKGFVEEAQQVSGEDVLAIDTGFLNVGHVDEVVNFLKISEKKRKELKLPKECNFLVLVASPDKARQMILDRINSNPSKYIDKSYKVPDATVEVVGSIDFSQIKSRFSFINQAWADELGVAELIRNADSCDDLTDNIIYDESRGGAVPDKMLTDKLDDLGCYGLSGLTLQQLVLDVEIAESNLGEVYEMKKDGTIVTKGKKNVDDSAMFRMDANLNRIKEKLAAKTGCKNPPVLEVPVLLEGGLSILPDAVNGVVQTGKNGGSNFISPKTYYPEFDKFLDDELDKYGVDLMSVTDLGYHIKKGEIHCGSNSARVCR